MKGGAPFLALLVFLFFSACARFTSQESPRFLPLPPSLFETLPPEKSLRLFSEFFLIDDFNTREARNRLGAPWELERPSRGRVRFQFIPRDSLQQKRGSSLALRVSLPPEGKTIFRSKLQSLDLSQAQALVFNCQVKTPGEKGFSGKLELLLKDSHERVSLQEVTSACLSGKVRANGWREVVIPRRQWKGLDWDGLGEIALRVSAGEEPLRTEVRVDEIAFYGTKELAFHSERDNLVGSPREVSSVGRVEALLRIDKEEKFLFEIARDTWKYFENALDRHTHLPVDHLRVQEPKAVGSYTTPTNLALYLFACVAARELGLISRKEALGRIQKSLETLRLMRRWQGFLYNFYHTGTLEVTRDYVSVVDSGWLAAAWMVLRQAFPKELGGLATRFLEEVNFYEFYDPSIGQLRLGFDEGMGSFSPYHYGLLATEARVASFIGIGKGDLPREHWWSIYRVPPKKWRWQRQIPRGRRAEIEGVSLLLGYYTYKGRRFVPSWGGSLFEFLMPTLILKEKELAPQSLGLNNRIATEIHLDYALNRQGYPIWGISPASTSSGRLWRYGEFGVKYLGVKGYQDEGVIAPYASFLALETFPKLAIRNLKKMLKLYNLYGEYGFYDSVNVRNGQINPQYLCLDQGMILVSIANYLKKGIIKEYFHQDEIAKVAESLLGKERWFK